MINKQVGAILLSAAMALQLTLPVVAQELETADAETEAPSVEVDEQENQECPHAFLAQSYEEAAENGYLYTCVKCGHQEVFAETVNAQSVSDVPEEGDDYGTRISSGSANFSGTAAWIKYDTNRDAVADLMVVRGTGLTEITMGYDNQGDIKTIIVEEGIKGLGFNALSSMRGATNILLPNSLESIDINCFEQSDAFETLNLPGNLQLIGSGAFWNCDALKTITIPQSVTAFGASAFRECDALESVKFNNCNTIVCKLSFLNCKKLKTVDFGNAVTALEDNVFQGCSALTTIAVPTSVKRMGVNVFLECSSLKNVTLGTGITMIPGATFSGCSSLEEITIPNSVTKISHIAFANCTNLKKIVIPASVTTFEAEAFMNVLNLTIYGYNNTEAQRFANLNGYTFVSMGDVPSLPFIDVPAGSYYYDAVVWALNNNITTGISQNLFGPKDSCTRGQIVTFIWRAAGCPEPRVSQCPFTDVNAGAYYYKPVLWAVENNITTGTSPTTFAPNAAVTRGQSVTFLYRAKKGTPGGSNRFVDVKRGAFYYDPVCWAVRNNITTGTSPTTFSPQDKCVRSQIVTFLYRAYK